MQHNGLPVRGTVVSLLLLCGVAATAAGVTWAGSRTLGSPRALPGVYQAVVPEPWAPAPAGGPRSAVDAGTGVASGADAPIAARALVPAYEQAVAPTYETVVGDDWRGYASVEELRSTRMLWWTDPRDVHGFVRLVDDPLLGRALRIAFPVNRGDAGPAPQIIRRFPRPLDRMWYRWRMRFSPGWTTAGPDPAGHANSYKIAFWGWEGFDSRGEIGYTNTDDYYLSVSVRERDTGAPLRFAQRLLPGSAATPGEVSAEWRDGEWYELVALYERTSANAFRQHWWRRRLSLHGRLSAGPWTWVGMEMTGAPAPRVDRVELGINKNKSTPAPQHIDWGPWEVVDGSRYPNPFGMPGF